MMHEEKHMEHYKQDRYWYARKALVLNTWLTLVDLFIVLPFALPTFLLRRLPLLSRALDLECLKKRKVKQQQQREQQRMAPLRARDVFITLCVPWMSTQQWK